MKLKPIQIPKSVVVEEENADYGRFTLDPLERGFGFTLGNALRRILLSSVQGAAITRMRIDGVDHEYVPIPGVMEDIIEIEIRLKKVRITADCDLPVTLEIRKKGPCTVKAGDIWTPAGVKIVNPDLEICTLGRNADLKADLEVTSGTGYCPIERIKTKNAPLGTIFLDAVFSPVTKVNFAVDNTRVGNRTDFDKLVVEVWTDGTIKPLDALSHSGKILKDYASVLINFEKEPETIVEEEVDEDKKRMKKLLSQKVEELELSVRAANCLKEAKLKNLGDLVQRSEQEMLKYKNFGKRSLQELVKVLESKGLRFGMDVSEYLEQEETEKSDEA
ncbi:DNA-directed RNA polymerase subunit alpha [candidate division WOR-3 bacterium]|nr:DNA-directed RNA polymerase subunit alpha [candidate division WOR-3 bacterium]